MLTASSSTIPGLYPLITKYDPAQKRTGKDNLGMGYTQHGEKFLLKNGGRLGAAEFVGAKICDACGIPACQPTVVTLETIDGVNDIFGSRVESGTHSFNQESVAEWKAVLDDCINSSAFSAVLAVDLVLGNDDRHWNNWLVQKTQSETGLDAYRLRAMDFSRGWPVRHPSQHPNKHAGKNTWNACKEWGLLGVDFDAAVFYDTCATIRRLSHKWLRTAALHPVKGIFLDSTEVNDLCSWWENHLEQQVIACIESMEYGVRP